MWKICIEEHATAYAALDETAAAAARIAVLACGDERREYMLALMQEAGGRSAAAFKDAREMADLDEKDFTDLATVIVAETRLSSR